MFSFEMSDQLQLIMRKLWKKDRKRAQIITDKIKEITSCDDESIEHYKNLRYELSDYKRVHIDSSFVLFFKVFKNDRHIIFSDLEHHDDAYR